RSALYSQRRTTESDHKDCSREAAQEFWLAVDFGGAGPVGAGPLGRIELVRQARNCAPSTRVQRTSRPACRRLGQRDPGRRRLDRQAYGEAVVSREDPIYLQSAGLARIG